MENDKIGSKVQLIVKEKTLSETMKTINKAHNAGYTTIISHKSGETENHIILDRTTKYNQKAFRGIANK